MSLLPYTHTVLLTGGTSGLGYYAALNIARQQPKYLVVITGGSDPDASAQKINTQLHQQSVAFLPLDLSSTTKVREFAESWATKNYPPIISLVLNAGTQLVGPMETNEEGYEKTFMINHLGHTLLFHLLIPYLSPDARIVITSSGTHNPTMTQKAKLPDAVYTNAEELAHPDPATAHPEGMQRYNSSKLANVLWTYTLARHLEDKKSRITANAYNPGLIFGTGLGRDYAPIMKFLWYHILPRMTPLIRLIMPYVRGVQESGECLAWLAVSPEAAAFNGRYVSDKKEVMSSADSYDVEKQDDLWKWTVKTTGAKGDGLEGLKL